MTTQSRQLPTIKTWHIVVFGVVCTLLLGFLAIRLIDNAKFSPIAIDPTGLSDLEVSAIEKAIEPIGAVQFFAADLTAIHQAVSKLSWAQSVEVRRDWHRGVTVSATPRIAVANFGSDQLLDADGVVFTPADVRMTNNPKLVYLYGHAEESKIIMQQTKRLNTWFAPLKMTVKDVILTPRKTWVVVFHNGMRVIVDHENAEQKLYNLSIHLSTSLKNELNKIQSADLRYKNGFVIAYKTA